MTLSATGMPKGNGTLIVKDARGYIVVQKNNVSDVYKTASSLKRKFETGGYSDETVQLAYNADPEGFTFEARAFDPAAELATEEAEINEQAAAEELVETLQRSEEIMDQLEEQAEKVGMSKAERVAATKAEAVRLGFTGGKWADDYKAMQEWKKANGFLGKPFGTAQR